MEKLRVDDFEIEENEWGYVFSTYFDFWEDEVGVTLDLDYNIKDEKELSEEEIREVIEKALKNNYSDYYHWLPRNDIYQGGYINFKKSESSIEKS